MCQHHNKKPHGVGEYKADMTFVFIKNQKQNNKLKNFKLFALGVLYTELISGGHISSFSRFASRIQSLAIPDAMRFFQISEISTIGLKPLIELLIHTIHPTGEWATYNHLG